jgi:hypothetical protein
MTDADPDNQGQALNLITFNKETGFELSPEARELLLSDELREEQIGVIAVAGKYRTGKSFLLNRILMGKKGDQNGFGVGPTINPCTKVSSHLVVPP